MFSLWFTITESFDKSNYKHIYYTWYKKGRNRIQCAIFPIVSYILYVFCYFQRPYFFRSLYVVLSFPSICSNLNVDPSIGAESRRQGSRRKRRRKRIMAMVILRLVYCPPIFLKWWGKLSLFIINYFTLVIIFWKLKKIRNKNNVKDFILERGLIPWYP